MRIVIARHAEAEEGSGDDAARKLTPEGREQAELLGKLLAATILPPDEIWTSPVVRCRETAEIAAKAMGRPVPPKVVPDLAPGASTDQLAWLCAKSGHRIVVLVGHAPDVGMLASSLLGFKGEHHFKKGAVCIVDITDPTAPPGRGVATLEPKQYTAVLRGEMYAPWMRTRLTV